MSTDIACAHSNAGRIDNATDHQGSSCLPLACLLWALQGYIRQSTWFSSLPRLGLDIDDVVQETIYRAMRKQSRAGLPTCEIALPLLREIAENYLRDRYRRARYEQEMELVEATPAGATDVSDHLCTEELIAALREKDRQVARLLLERYRKMEIAKRLGKSPSWVTHACKRIEALIDRN